MIKAADMMIARRADTRARADFATWKMMAKLNGASSLPAEAQTFLARYKALLKEMTEPKQRKPPSSSSTKAITRRWAAPARRPMSRPIRADPATGNVTAFKRPPAQRPNAPVVRKQNPGCRWP